MSDNEMIPSSLDDELAQAKRIFQKTAGHLTLDTKLANALWVGDSSSELVIKNYKTKKSVLDNAFFNLSQAAKATNTPVVYLNIDERVIEGMRVDKYRKDDELFPELLIPSPSYLSYLIETSLQTMEEHPRTCKLDAVKEVRSVYGKKSKQNMKTFNWLECFYKKRHLERNFLGDTSSTEAMLFTMFSYFVRGSSVNLPYPVINFSGLPNIPKTETPLSDLLDGKITSDSFTTEETIRIAFDLYPRISSLFRLALRGDTHNCNMNQAIVVPGWLVDIGTTSEDITKCKYYEKFKKVSLVQDFQFPDAYGTISWMLSGINSRRKYEC